MSKPSFSKPPLLSDKEKEKRAQKFLEPSGSVEKSQHSSFKGARAKKQKPKSVYLRAPESLWEDIQEIVAITGVSMNAVCLEILRPGIKAKLRELKDEL